MTVANVSRQGAVVPLGAVIVVYFPDMEALEERVEVLRAVTSLVVVVDNSGCEGVRRELVRRFWGRDDVEYLDMAGNTGVAVALNAGTSVVGKHACEYVIYFDQDSVIEGATVERLLEQFRSLAGQGIPIGGIGPDPVNSRDGCRLGQPVPGRNRRLWQCVRERSEVITSGFLTSLAVLKQVGPFLDGLFIDFVDFEWCWRAGKAGLVVGVDEGCRMLHTLGSRDVRMLGIRWQIGAPIRSYFQFRNYLLLLRLPHTPRYFVVRKGLALLFDGLTMPFVREGRKARIRWALRGIWDGLRGAKGAAGCES